MLPLKRFSAVLAWIAIGGVAGWYLHDYRIEKSADTVAFAHRAVVAHMGYSPEVRHPVEVGADQEAHLVAWLSKRIGASPKRPQLAPLGDHLVCGRLRPGSPGLVEAAVVTWKIFRADSVRRPKPTRSPRQRAFA